MSPQDNWEDRVQGKLRLELGIVSLNWLFI